MKYVPFSTLSAISLESNMQICQAYKNRRNSQRCGHWGYRFSFEGHSAGTKEKEILGFSMPFKPSSSGSQLFCLCLWTEGLTCHVPHSNWGCDSHESGEQRLKRHLSTLIQMCTLPLGQQNHCKEWQINSMFRMGNWDKGTEDEEKGRWRRRKTTVEENPENVHMGVW